jgi:hypothetical protein
MAVTGRGAGGMRRALAPRVAATTWISSPRRSTAADSVSTSAVYSDIRRRAPVLAGGDSSSTAASASSSAMASVSAECRGRWSMTLSSLRQRR